MKDPLNDVVDSLRHYINNKVTPDFMVDDLNILVSELVDEVENLPIWDSWGVEDKWNRK